MTRFASPRLLIVLAALLFSTGGVAVKFVDLTGWQTASYRSGIAAIALFFMLPAARRGMTWRSALVAVAYALTMVLFVLANRLTTGANTIYLQSTAPLYLLLLGPLLLSEPLRRRDAPIIVAVLGGLALVMLGADLPSATAPNPPLGNTLALISGLTYASMLLGLRWLGREGGRNEEGQAAMVLGNLFACVGTLPMAVTAGAVGAVDLSVLVYLGVFQIGFAYVMLTAGIRHVPALQASLLLLLEAALNPVWTWLLMGESPTALALVGGALIVGATVMQAARPAQVEVVV